QALHSLTAIPVPLCFDEEKRGEFPPLFPISISSATPLGRGPFLADGTNFAGLWALLSLCCFVLDLLTFVEGLVAVTLNPAEVDEQILAAVVRGDKAVALFCIEPLNCSKCHEIPPLTRATNRLCSLLMPTEYDTRSAIIQQIVGKPSTRACTMSDESR